MRLPSLEEATKNVNASMEQLMSQLPKVDQEAGGGEMMTCNECKGAPLCTDADPVQKPSHYMLEGLDIEAIDVIRSVLGDGFGAYCRGNVLKYLIRADHKGRRVEDLRKAAKYIEWEIEAREEEG